MKNKTKNIVLVISTLLALVLCYKLAIVETLEVKNRFDTLKKESVLFKNIPKQLSILKQKETYYNDLLIKYQLNGNSIQNNLLKVINTFSKKNNVQLISFLEPHTYHQNELVVKTYEFTIQGNYDKLIELIYKLEQETKFGEIQNLQFKKQKNLKTGKTYLQTHVLLKSFY